jgi:release factor glutamine methyltransferase
MPVAQLVGYREFYSLRFRVNEDVLIPRPETEHLVVEAIACAKQIERDRVRIADLGTGSGAIAVALAKYLPNSDVTAVDCSPNALMIAEWNARQHDVEDRLEFVQSDLFEALDSAHPFDIVCSNPPYISQAEYDALDPTVREFEPKQALLAGPQGTEVIEAILGSAPDYLTSGGHLIIEFSPMIADACIALAEEQGSYRDVHCLKDLDGHQRLMSMVRR